MYNTCRIKILTGDNKDEIFDFSKFVVSIGSLGTDDIKLSSLSGVLPNHVTIRQEDDKFFFLNNCFSSVNVNGKPLTEGELIDGDEIQFGTIGPKLLFKTDLTEVPSEKPEDFIVLKPAEEEYPEVKKLEYAEELPFENKTVIEEPLIEKLEIKVSDDIKIPEDVKAIEDNASPVQDSIDSIIESSENEPDKTSSLEHFDELPLEEPIKNQVGEDIIIEKEEIKVIENNVSVEIASPVEDPIDSIIPESSEDEPGKMPSFENFDELSLDELIKNQADEDIILKKIEEVALSPSEDINTDPIKEIASDFKTNEPPKPVKEPPKETVKKKKPLMIKKANYRKTTYGANIDELETTVNTDETIKIEKFIKKSFEPKKQTRQEMLDEMTTIIDEHNKKQKYNNSDDDERTNKVKKGYRAGDKPTFSVDNMAYSSEHKTTDKPPYLPYICVAGVVSAILFMIGLSISNNGLSFFTLAPIVVSLIAVDLINNTYRFDENRLTNSIFMAMGIIIFQTVVVMVLSLIGSLDQIGQYDMLSYILNQIMLLSHQFIMCIVMLFVTCVVTIIYVQSKFSDSI